MSRSQIEISHISVSDSFLTFEQEISLEKSIVHMDYLAFSGVGILFTSSQDRFDSRSKSPIPKDKFQKTREVNTLAIDSLAKRPELTLNFFDEKLNLKTQDLTFFSLTKSLTTHDRAKKQDNFATASVKTFHFVNKLDASFSKAKPYVASTLVIVSAANPQKLTNVNNMCIAVITDLIRGSNGRYSRFDVGPALSSAIDSVVKVKD